MASQPARRWMRVLPVVFVTYSLTYLDRSNYGFGAAAGLAATLDISKDRAALLGARSSSSGTSSSRFLARHWRLA
jgi:hypothetical protein